MTKIKNSIKPCKIVAFMCAFCIISCQNKPAAQNGYQQPQENAKAKSDNMKPDTLNGNFMLYKNLYKEFYVNGNLKVEGNMVDGKRIGQWFSYYEDGMIWSEMNYNKEGRRHGANVSYYENGTKRYEGQYIDDLQKGKWLYYNKDGTLAKEVDYN
jgi:antitoxin component YwqK of YwqJK toxin-antitoxin module